VTGISTRALRAWGLALLLPLAGGCLATAIAVGAGAAFGIVMYSENEAYRDFHAGLDEAWNRTLISMRELGYPVQEGIPHGPTEGKIVVNDATVHVTTESGGFTRIRVRIGTFLSDDNRRRATLLLEKIADGLR
jgi:hypothetical protein